MDPHGKSYAPRRQAKNALHYYKIGCHFENYLA
jgi:hypothetical protein